MVEGNSALLLCCPFTLHALRVLSLEAVPLRPRPRQLREVLVRLRPQTVDLLVLPSFEHSPAFDRHSLMSHSFEECSEVLR